MKLDLKAILSIILVFFLFLLVTVEKINILPKQNTLEVIIENEEIREKIKFQLTTQQIAFCKVSFTAPWFVVYNPDGSYLMVIDSQGNLFINSTVQRYTVPNQVGWRNAFIIRDQTSINFAVNSTIGQIRGTIYENSITFPSTNSFIVRNSTHVLAAFDNVNFYLRGRVVYNGQNDLCYNRSYCEDCERRGLIYNYRCWNGICEEFCDRYCLPGYSCAPPCPA